MIALRCPGWCLPSVTLVALAAATAAGSAKPGAPQRAPFRVVQTRDGPVVRLSPALARAVASRYGGYRLPTPAEEDPQLHVICHERDPGSQVTYAAVGDFNGDGLTDAVLRLRGRRSRDEAVVVVFHATRAGRFEPHLLDLPSRAGASFCVLRRLPGRIAYRRFSGEEVLSQPGILQLRRAGIELMEPESWARVYYWDGSRYRHVQTHD